MAATAKPFGELTLCTTPLSHSEAVSLEADMAPLIRYLGAPGDWGYNTQLGRLTQALHTVRAGVQAAVQATADHRTDAEQEVVRLRRLMAEAVRALHGRGVLFSTAFRAAAAQADEGAPPT